VDIAEMLIAHGADVNAAAADGTTPIMTALGEKMVTTLVKAGADVNARTSTGRTAINNIAHSDLSEIGALEALLKAGRTPTLAGLTA
jgi:ankyrin repeat protein